MGVFGIGLRMGVALWGTRTFESALDRVLDDSGAGDQLATAEALGVDTGLPQGAEDIAIAPGPSMLLALPINLGGVVFFRMEPMLTAGEFTTLGGYMGLGANIHLKRAYISIGVGGMGDLLLDDRFEVAADLYFRVPIDVYWYVLDDFGLFVELAGGAGISVAQPAGAQDVSTAGGTMFDFSLGLRVP
ncbi:MAG: hypothetical protein OXU20_25570 [Myxococcales bacterium]|nr:hypothetical protein [Myxococcales bacterium]MDD9968458.1 hypothetical protein [Myxococcales bacterium]